MKYQLTLLPLLLLLLGTVLLRPVATHSQAPLARRQSGENPKQQAAGPEQSAVPAAVRLENSLTAKFVDEANQCRKPAAVSRFAPTDERVWLWFDVTGAAPGDRARAEWYDPQGNLYSSVSWNPLAAGGYRCFWAWLSLANSQAAIKPGRWRVRVLYNDNFFFSLNFALGTANLGDSVVARALGTGNQCQAPAYTSVLYTTDQDVWVWFSVRDALPGDFSRIEWYEPGGSLYSTYHQGPPGITWTGNGCFWFSLAIANQPPATKPGRWSARVFYNNASFFTSFFELTAARHNALLAFQVTGNGRFNAGAAPDPATGRAGANSYGLIYRWPSAPGTSFTTFRVDGRDLVYGEDGVWVEAPANIDAKTNRSRWRSGALEITQLLQLAFNGQTGREDVMRISYTVRNLGATAQQVGGRVLIDTDINQNDGVPFRVPGEGIIRQEREFSGASMPDSFQAFFDVTDTQRITVSTLRSGGATAPDRLVLGSWPQMFDTRYDYAIDPNLDFTDDSAYAVYWSPRPLAPGDSRSYTTFYGLSAVQVNLEPPLALGLSGPAALSVVNNAYSPNPFDVVATVRNTGSTAVSNVQVTLNLPNGLSLAGGTAAVTLGQLGAGQERQVSWRVTTGARTGAGTYTYSVTLTATNLAAKTVSRSVILPPFSVTHSLSGTVGIWDGKEFWKLNGTGVKVYVTAQSGQFSRTEEANEGGYSFSNLPAGNYRLTARLEYLDKVTVGNPIILPGPLAGGCVGRSLPKLTQAIVNNVMVQGDTTVNLDFPPPVVLLHGVKSCYEKWYSTEAGAQTKYWDNFLQAQGLITFAPNYNSYLTADWPQRAKQIQNQVEQNFRQLTKEVETRHRYPAWFLIAHSMGGLTARVLVYQNEAAALTASLQKLYLLGTPNSGAYGRWYAYYFPFGSLLNRVGISYPLYGYLSEETITTRFNKDYRTFGEKRLTVFAGDAKSINTQPSDGVVREHSVYHIEIKNNLLSFANFQPLKLAGKTLRYEHEELGSLATLKPILVDEILPDMTRLAPPRTTASVPVMLPIEPSAEVNTATTEALAVASGFAPEWQKVAVAGQTLAAAQTAEQRFTIGATDAFTFSPLVLEGQATFTLTSPAGQVIYFNTPAPELAEKTADEFGEVLLVRQPAPGQWQLTATAGAAASAFVYLVQENSPVKLTGVIKEEQIKVGQLATLLARLEGVGSPAQVTARLVNEAGETIETLSLFDDGEHRDNRPNDGLFGAATQPLRSSGRHFASFTAQSVFNGQACTRQTEAFVDVLPATRLLTGPFSNSAVDADADNRIESLRLAATFNAPAAGSYQLAADLLDAQGFRVAHALGQVEANAPGTLSAKLDFNLTGVLCQQFTSAFTIQNLSLSSGTELKVLDVWSEGINTQRYDGALFNCNNSAITPSLRSLQPAALFPGAVGQLVLSGAGFANGARVSLGTGITVWAVTRLNSELLIAEVSLDANAALGPRAVTVSNPDGPSATFTNLFSVAADQPPTVQLFLPPGQQPLRGTVTISATAADDRGIQKVEFYLDSQLVTSDTDFPYQFVWQTTATPNGNHTLLARAYDTAGQTRATELTVAVNNAAVATVSAASFSAARLASESIAAAFGVGLATNVQTATTLPLPTALAGTTVKVRDSAGVERLAPLFFVAPSQVNYLIPAGTSGGTATVTITSGNGELASGTILIATVAPGLFSANANGQGVAAAVALRLKANGQQLFEPVARLDTSTSRYVSLPLDLGEPGDQIFLLLFGTGVRQRSALQNVTAKIGGVDAAVSYAGAQGGFVGLDQINVALPRALAGRGEVDVALLVDSQPANVVRIAIR